MLLSIIMPVYNQEKYLDQSITSVLNQTYKNFELIIINDGSTDKSLEIIREYQSKDKRIRVLNIENQGVSHAKNLGILKSRGYYVLFIDPDDFYMSDFCEYMVDLADKFKTSVVMCNYVLVKDDVSYENKLRKEILDLQNPVTKNNMNDLIIGERCFRGFMCNKMYRRDLIVDAKFDENISVMEDLLYNVKLFGKVKGVSYGSKAKYFYRQNENSVTHKFDNNWLTSIKELRRNVFQNDRKRIDASTLYTLVKVSYRPMVPRRRIINEITKLKEGKSMNYFHLENSFKNIILKVAYINTRMGFILINILESIITSEFYSRVRAKR